jgi:hypothetical protein
MSKIYGFGDSFTEGQPIECTFPAFMKWKEIRGGDLPKCWLDILGEKFNMEVINHGRGGNSNQQIFHDLCENAHLFENGDMVFVNWTHKTRFRWAALEKHTSGEIVHKDKYGNPTDSFRRLSSNNLTGEDFVYITKSTKDEIVQNRFSVQYSLEVYAYENLIESYGKTKGFDVYFWSADDDIINKLPIEERKVKKYICADIINDRLIFDSINSSGLLMDYIKLHGGKTIDLETNYEVVDNIHFGESGHKIQADLFYNHITKYTPKLI